MASWNGHRNIHGNSTVRDRTDHTIHASEQRFDCLYAIQADGLCRRTISDVPSKYVTAILCQASGWTLSIGSAASFSGATSVLMVTPAQVYYQAPSSSHTGPSSSSFASTPDARTISSTSAKPAPLFPTNIFSLISTVPNTVSAPNTATSSTVYLATYGTPKISAPAVRPHTSSERKTGLSTSAIIGLGVSATVVLLALLALAIFCCRRRRRQKKQLQLPQNASVGTTDLPFTGMGEKDDHLAAADNNTAPFPPPKNDRPAMSTEQLEMSVLQPPRRAPEQPTADIQAPASVYAGPPGSVPPRPGQLAQPPIGTWGYYTASREAIDGSIALDSRPRQTPEPTIPSSPRPPSVSSEESVDIDQAMSEFRRARLEQRGLLRTRPAETRKTTQDKGSKEASS
ncbi:hypothetical protein B0H63DRAFT_519021 [Podospora didyma]|uniref:Uncharacterized protein n=1 Tax=Podospora didyma TaxID=330526 RepID=A0AAE0NXZ3_9PEZI|nr:hypothetical protein B0H63DRAFT_519021 [Podospora didyma]